ncbi:hypothetical protein P3T37_004086 [Kitasatospora sp. MAA4]|nr:hypothetical protein [Kitasatospora sp. MAA4]
MDKHIAGVAHATGVPAPGNANGRPTGRRGGADGQASEGRYFHWVERPKPAAMKPKPARMFQLPHTCTGQVPPVT